ncbi:hypothetical protein ACHAWU_009337 [Discostella pseudostelligera]|uniref:Uncharacterized protein n=1 Tax=Discostella pseudostelligera TaxID=259834 RepID=A0ABD3N596_9STRA
MDAADLAREVCAYNQLLDRPSRLVLAVIPVGTIRMAKEFTLKVTAPVENGSQIVRCEIPSFPPPRSRRTVLDYEFTNLEGVAACIEGYMLNNNIHELRLFEVTNGEFFENDSLVGKWSFNNENERVNDSRLQRILSILKSLFILG